MEKITNAFLLRPEASSAHIALTYGVAGLLVGMLFLGDK